MSLPGLQLYLDEDVNVLIAALLRAHGLKATTTREAQQNGNTDSAQLEFAVEHRLTLLTHNRVHFEILARQYVTSAKLHYCSVSRYSGRKLSG